jgi:hypothetical protein
MAKLSAAAVEQAKVQRDQARAAFLTAQSARVQAEALRNTSDSTKEAVLISKIMADDAHESARDERIFQRKSLELEIPQIFLTELAIEKIRPSAAGGYLVDLSAVVENAGRTPIIISRVLLTAMELENKKRPIEPPRSRESIKEMADARAKAINDLNELLANSRSSLVDFSDVMYKMERDKRYLKPGDSFRIEDSRPSDRLYDGGLPTAMKVFVVINYRDIFGSSKTYCKTMIGYLSRNLSLRRVLDTSDSVLEELYKPVSEKEECAQFSRPA